MKNFKEQNYILLTQNNNFFVHPSFFIIRIICGYDNYYNEMRNIYMELNQEEKNDCNAIVELSYLINVNTSNYFYNYFFECSVLEDYINSLPTLKLLNYLKNTLNNYYDRYIHSIPSPHATINYLIKNIKNDKVLYKKNVNLIELISDKNVESRLITLIHNKFSLISDIDFSWKNANNISKAVPVNMFFKWNKIIDNNDKECIKSFYKIL